MKCDLHIHSHYSYDSNSSIKEIIDTAIKKGIDCIAITDHNTCEWIEPLRNAKDLSTNPTIQALTILPGVEITTHDGVHVLAIFDENKPESELVNFIRSIGLKPAEIAEILNSTGDKISKQLYVVKTKKGRKGRK